MNHFRTRHAATAFSPIGVLYCFLYAAGIVAINPFVITLNPAIDPHYIRGLTWTQPKMVVFALIILTNLAAILHYLRQTPTPRRPARQWFRSGGLWGIFLGIGTVSTLLSPVPLRSFTGHSVMGDGLLYWTGMALFVHTHAYLLLIRPRLARYQLGGIVFGGLICAFALFPQLLDWRIDYTVTSGMQMNAHRLLSGIGKSQMPIGLFSHRGNVGFVLAAVCSLLGVCIPRVDKRLKVVVIAGYFVCCLALIFTGTRGPMLAWVVGLLYLTGRLWRRPPLRRQVVVWGAGLYAVAYLVANLAIATGSFTVRQKPMVSRSLDSFSSTRTTLFRMAGQAVGRRPLHGWGFDGFAISFYHLVREGALKDTTGEGALEPGRRVRVNKFVSKTMNADGEITTLYHAEAKAHNLLFDLAISVGLPGAIVYLVLLAYSWRVTDQGLFAASGVVGVVYVAYTFTWFECAQFSHIAWWALGAGLARGPRNRSRFAAL